MATATKTKKAAPKAAPAPKPAKITPIEPTIEDFRATMWSLALAIM